MTMPNFLLIGAAKSGTSALYAYLQQHPHIFTCAIKETGFFALEGERPHFAGPGDGHANGRFITELGRYQALFGRVNGEVAIGESSDMYLYSPKAPARIRHYLPGVKLIAILRNPVDRAYSAYRHMVRDGREPLASFEQAWAEEDARIAANWLPIWHLRQPGFYHSQLKRYFELFDREQIAVYTYDEFEADPGRIMGAIFDFLGVDTAFRPDMSVRHNVSGTPRSQVLHEILVRRSAIKDFIKPLLPRSGRDRLIRLRGALMQRNTVAGGPRLAPETRRSIMQVYRDDILQLESLIDRDLSEWLRT
jgi:Sulfotransferase domain